MFPCLQPFHVMRTLTRVEITESVLTGLSKALRAISVSATTRMQAPTVVGHILQV